MSQCGCRVQEELGMLPGEASHNLTPTSTMAHPADYTSASPPYGQQFSANPRDELPMRESEVYLAGSSSLSDNEEMLNPTAGNDAADEAAGDESCESSGQYAAAAAEADEDLYMAAREAEDEVGSEAAGTESLTSPQNTEDAHDSLRAGANPQLEHQGNSRDAGQSPQDWSNPYAMSGDTSGDGLQAPSGGSGIMDEYLRRMHFSKETPLPTPAGDSTPIPPVGVAARVSMPRRWTKTKSYPDSELCSIYTAAARLCFLPMLLCYYFC